jgi:hypothetical protein
MNFHIHPMLSLRIHETLFLSTCSVENDEYESSLAKEIEEDIDYDQKSVWSIINKRKKNPSICNALKKGE